MIKDEVFEKLDDDVKIKEIVEKTLQQYLFKSNKYKIIVSV